MNWIAEIFLPYIDKNLLADKEIFSLHDEKNEEYLLTDEVLKRELREQGISTYKIF